MYFGSFEALSIAAKERLHIEDNEVHEYFLCAITDMIETLWQKITAKRSSAIPYKENDAQITGSELSLSLIDLLTKRWWVLIMFFYVFLKVLVMVAS